MAKQKSRSDKLMALISNSWSKKPEGEFEKAIQAFIALDVKTVTSAGSVRKPKTKKPKKEKRWDDYPPFSKMKKGIGSY